ncbi:MAG: dihydroorotase [Candidatus Gastranaerophilales bacterium]|nr:dihydroorotase [Candidatus Gastranaerophilales bacterium]
MLLKNAKIVNPSNNYEDYADIRIKNNNISEISKNMNPENNEKVMDLTGKIIIPGLIDMHCHLREPGFCAKETIKTGIESAINGGYTAICPMANTNPVVDNKETLKYIIDRAHEVSESGFYPICAVTKGLNQEKITNISELIDNGAIAFSNDGKPIENMYLLREALKYVNSQNKIIISHSEDSSLSEGGVINEGKISEVSGLKGIPSIAESMAIARELEVVRSISGARYHFAHVSTKRSIELIRQAKKDGLNITAETAPHYFSLTQEDIKEFDSKYKVNPPLRTKEDLNAVVQGLKDGTIDVIATDHAPHTLNEKLLPIQNAPMGMVGFETALGVTLTFLVHTKKLSLIEAVRKLTYNPSKILNLENQGDIKTGGEANLAIIDLDEEWTVNAANFKSKCKLSPFEGFKLKGKVKYTIIKGKVYNAY